jgi:hypothetical protein
MPTLMTQKEPVLLTVLIETSELRWFIAGISLNGEAIPLMRSAPGNLRPYVGNAFDEQVSFLRHRLSGVLQRGCDRLWGRAKKPCHVVFVADACFEHAPAELIERVAEHFVIWMTSPPVAFFISDNRFPTDKAFALRNLAGELPESYRTALDAGLPVLSAARESSNVWEEAPEKSSK